MINKLPFIGITFLMTILITTGCTLLEKYETTPHENNNANQQLETNNEQVDENSTPVTKPDADAEQNDTVLLPEVMLQKLDQSEDVRFLQEALIQVGYEIEADGIFDEMTTWAITDLQLQDDTLDATGIYDPKTQHALSKLIEKELQIEQGAGLAKPQLDQADEPIKRIENPYDILSLVNKQHALPGDYIPHDLVIPNVRFPFTEDLPKKQLRRVAAYALEDLFEAADEAQLNLFGQSGYRSYDRQEVLFASYVSNHGEEAANNFSARPGESEHQSGLTMDVTSQNVGFNLTTDFGKTDEGKWLNVHASDFGFIIRYPEDKVAITEYQYEPWHIRYVGKKAAKIIMDNHLTLEEYLGVK